MIRVVVAEDHALVREGLRVLLDLQDDIEVVGEAADGVEVPGAVTATRPDVVLLDVRMPQVDGIAATRAIVARDPAPRVLVMTTFEHDDHVLDALRAGAHGFLLKRARPQDLAQAVRVVALGESLLFPDAVRRLATAHPARGDALRSARLSEREGEVLRLMATGRSNQEIASELFLGVETVRTHVGNLLGKLGVRDRTQAVVAAYESGFVRPAL